MTELAIPDLLKGKWDHAVILTYGAEIPLFESALLRQFAESCRNKVILADGKRFLDACSHYAKPGLIRHLNRLYVADGILTPHAAHAKAILLTNSEEGRLLVGSGNLGMQGYASGGELFTKYVFTTDFQDHLNAFLAVRELLEALTQQEYVGRAAVERIQHLFDQTPWLNWQPASNTRPVRHNLQQDFVTQLADLLHDEPVEELWVLSPFFDKRAVALNELLDRLRPRQTKLLLQPGYVSLVPSAVESVMQSHADKLSIHPIARNDDSPYLHAKLYLVKTPTRALCLQGSPNLSQVAMMRVPPHGNFELANLLVGDRNEFDPILDELTIGSPVHSLHELNIEEVDEGDEQSVVNADWYLTRGELDGEELILHYCGRLPDLAAAMIDINDEHFDFELTHMESGRIALALDAAALALFEHAVPVSLVWHTAKGEEPSNPIFVHNLNALNRTLTIDVRDGNVDGFADLNLYDEEMELLLDKLESTLVLDREQAWHLVGRTAPEDSESMTEGPSISIDEVDYDLIRRHPKIQQYLRGQVSSTRYGQSWLQRILASITDHFRGLLDPTTIGPQIQAALEPGQPDLPETEEEAEQEEQEQQKRSQSAGKRVRRVLINFLDRYLRGMRSNKFQLEAGSDVMIQNYVIFSHLLWRLFAKDWIEPQLILKYAIDINKLYWGDETVDGYLASLPDGERIAGLEMIRQHYADARLIATFYHGATALRNESQADRHTLFQLRDQWRATLCSPYLSLTNDLVEAVWIYVSSIHAYEPPRPTTIAAKLTQLADFETRNAFLRNLEHRLQLPDHSCKIAPTTVFRPEMNAEDSIECLLLGRNLSCLSQELAMELIRRWMRIEPRLDYYRVTTSTQDQMAYYDARSASGLYFDKQKEEEHSIGRLPPWPTKWEEGVQSMQSLFESVDAEMSIQIPQTLTTIIEPSDRDPE